MAGKEYYDFTSPAGRLVSGSPDKFKTTDQTGQPLTYKGGTNAGEPRKEYRIGVAYRKNQRDVQAFMKELNGYAARQWPEYFDDHLNCTFKGFAGKVTDGDSTEMNRNQRRPCDNPDWRGCWIVWYTTDQEPDCYADKGAKKIPANHIKTGYYVHVDASTCRNSGNTPGMYMNLRGLNLAGYGPEINNRPDSGDAFRRMETADVPEGMSMVPLEKGDEPVAEDTPPPPSAPPAETTVQKVKYQGVIYDTRTLIERGWTEAQVAALPRA